MPDYDPVEDDDSEPNLSRRAFGATVGGATLAIAATSMATLLPNPPRATLVGRVPGSTAGGNIGRIAAARGLCFGSAISNTPFRDKPDYRVLYADYCNVLVHGSALQWHETQSKPGGAYDFSRAEAMYAWGTRVGKVFRGHSMLDWSGLPPWIVSGIMAATPAQAEKLLRDHVTAYAAHWKGRFIQWNVVNEPVNGATKPHSWFKKLGERYIDLAFATAHDIDPRTPLSLNQNLVEMDGWYQQRVLADLLALVQRLKSRKVPIRSVGIEGHLVSGQQVNQAGLDDFCKALARLGVTFMITEFDVDDRELPGDPAKRDAAAASLARDFFDVTLSQPNCEGLIAWDLSDRENWITRNAKKARIDGLRQRPALLDDAYRPKLMWQAAIEAIRRAPGPGAASLLPGCGGRG